LEKKTTNARGQICSYNLLVMHKITKLQRKKAAKRRLLKGVKKEFEGGWIGRRRKQMTTEKAHSKEYVPLVPLTLFSPLHPEDLCGSPP
jgi:hypothetical protein